MDTSLVRKSEQLRAYETQLEFSGQGGHAVVVECDAQWRFVFRDKAQYVGCVDLGGGVWFTAEWCETNSPNDLHCYEPIMDKQLGWSRIQILESGPARACAVDLRLGGHTLSCYPRQHPG
jgi:hypothetical protein